MLQSLELQCCHNCNLGCACTCRATKLLGAPALQAFMFDRLRLSVPSVASELLAQRQRLLAERGCMTQVANKYNHLLQALSREERRLFKDRIRSV